ncbi:Serine/threonine-protein kinase BRI1-like 2 [Vitis vinifera]|uniref:Serine/threonine-protein kinase BRI1-like 2 n=1 Tax=Vitis vinifera TaxID=29760 RepID=A0A438JGT4_VITVI|nr:Serine/threonine-protein kinase BRI1-like 2 [Vitis vinifera]
MPKLPSTINVLDLGQNMFSGPISSLYTNRIGSLSYLDLSHNLLSGELPDCELPSSLKNCTKLTLIGKIPAWVGESLSDLAVLNLRSNGFNGRIPSSLCQLKMLQILDLSRNNISGARPRYFNNFTAMTQKGPPVIVYDYSAITKPSSRGYESLGIYFDSKIPSGTQLQSFNASAYMGIPQLCGPPLLKECSRDDKEQYPPSSDSSGDSIQCDEDDPCFYASIALGFITGFWGVCGSLMLSNT